jgi:hypothetical protein
MAVTLAIPLRGEIRHTHAKPKRLSVSESRPCSLAHLPDSNPVIDGQFPVNDQSYRAFTFDWSGRPPGRPAIAVRPNPARGSAVYVSWNGATEVASWTVHAGRTSAALTVAGAQRRAGFESVIPVNSDGPYFAVTAHDSSGRQLGQSATVRRASA